LFAKLRSVRKRLADGEGVPAYAIFTNEQLAAMIRAGVRSRAELAAIDGVGEARVAKYGAAFLEVLTDDAGKGAPAKGLPADEPKQGDARARR
jgi:superfamily II DNA helicase RecQ